MKKRYIMLALLIPAIVFTGCQKKDGAAAKAFKVGMVTDAGTIDDKSFNQGTWEGVVKAGKDFKLETKYLKPSGTTEADYVKEIGNLYDAGYKFIVCPGFKFESAIFITQDKYPDAKFVLIDGSPNNGKYDDTRQAKVGTNTVAISYAEHESGFIAGVAAALQLKDGEIGFIGGMEIPAVQRFNWGFQQGVQYANANLGTNIVQRAENVIYQGSFDNVAAGQQLAAAMYDKGVKAIFAAAGGVGVGAINEAKARAVAGKTAWIIGVDVDQYADGVYDTAANKSVILTSAMKGIGVSSFDMVKAEREGKFPGGQTLIFDTKNDGVGIPAKNPNLSADVQKKVEKVVADIKAGKITVAAERGSLLK